MAAFILTNDAEISRKINSAIFPGLQGGPLMHVIAAKAVAFSEALQPAFRQYTIDVIGNCQVLADTLAQGGRIADRLRRHGHASRRRRSSAVRRDRG